MLVGYEPDLSLIYVVKVPSRLKVSGYYKSETQHVYFVCFGVYITRKMYILIINWQIFFDYLCTVSTWPDTIYLHHSRLVHTANSNMVKALHILWSENLQVMGRQWSVFWVKNSMSCGEWFWVDLASFRTWMVVHVKRQNVTQVITPCLKNNCFTIMTWVSL